MSGIFDYVLRHNRIEFIGDPTALELSRVPELNNISPPIALVLFSRGIILTPRSAIVLGNALIDLAHNREHWKHPPAEKRV